MLKMDIWNSEGIKKSKEWLEPEISKSKITVVEEYKLPSKDNYKC